MSAVVPAVSEVTATPYRLQSPVRGVVHVLTYVRHGEMSYREMQIGHLSTVGIQVCTAGAIQVGVPKDLPSIVKMTGSRELKHQQCSDLLIAVLIKV